MKEFQATQDSKVILQMENKSYFNHGQENLFTSTETIFYYHKQQPTTNIHNYASIAWVSGRNLAKGGMTDLKLFVH